MFLCLCPQCARKPEAAWTTRLGEHSPPFPPPLTGAPLQASKTRADRAIPTMVVFTPDCTFSYSRIPTYTPTPPTFCYHKSRSTIELPTLRHILCLATSTSQTCIAALRRLCPSSLRISRHFFDPVVLCARAVVPSRGGHGKRERPALLG